MATDTEGDNGRGPVEDDFLSRWSRRKHEARGVEPRHVDAEDEAPAAQDDAAPAPVDEDMPPVDSLDERSDVSGFFSSGVSEELRLKALRRVFHLERYHRRDGLDDYDADYRNFKPLGEVMTADLRLRRERLAQRAEELAKERVPEEDDSVPSATEAEPGDDDAAERARQTPDRD